MILSGFSGSDFDWISHLETVNELWKVPSITKALLLRECVKYLQYIYIDNRILRNFSSVDDFYDTTYAQYEISRHILSGLAMTN